MKCSIESLERQLREASESAAKSEDTIKSLEEEKQSNEKLIKEFRETFREREPVGAAPSSGRQYHSMSPSSRKRRGRHV